MTRLDEITEVGLTAAQTIIAEIGVDMTRFSTPAHLDCWARFAPRISESAGRKKGNSRTGHGNRYLARVLGEAAVAAGRTDTFVGERYRRIAPKTRQPAGRRRGRPVHFVVIWQLLSNDQARFIDLGSGYYVNLSPKMSSHVRELQRLGYKVTLEPAA